MKLNSDFLFVAGMKGQDKPKGMQLLVRSRMAARETKVKLTLLSNPARKKLKSPFSSSRYSR